ncbi:MAG: serine/threonine protein kinase [Fimbriimonadaceae bacterium]
MPVSPEPLPAGVVLADRFEIEHVIGRGGFGTAYLAKDRARNDEVVVKELAPAGSVRRADGLLDLDGLGHAAAQRLRRSFLDEARLLARLNIPGVVNVRSYGAEGGSAYYVTDYFADAEPLDQVLARMHKFPVEGALDIGFQLIETLEGVHRRRILHRDIKPANVLLRKNGQTVLIDFGAAREWHADVTEHHTVLFTPGYAPLEQLSERAKRGPATDVYGLAALIYTLLAGFPPTAATDRLNGVPLAPLRQVCPEVDILVTQAVEAGLALQYSERPQTVSEFRALFSERAAAALPSRLEAIDATMEGLRKLAFGRRQCPACGDVLAVVSPLPRARCPVCDRGTIKARAIHAAVCPACRLGVLRKAINECPLAVCPLCEEGLLIRRRAKLLSKEFVFTCDQCEAEFCQQQDSVTLTHAGAGAEYAGRSDSWAGWAKLTHRSHEIQVCDGCHAQFDLLADGQWKQMTPLPETGKPARLYPEEWARVAAGLDPSCGTHACNVCEADYFVDGERVTLLGAHDDPFHYAEANIGRPLTWDQMRWLGVGKSSEKPGPSCPRCGTEFDSEGDYLRLVRSDYRPLAAHVGRLQTLEDWHRIARGLPRADEQPAFEARLGEALLRAFIEGELTFDDKGSLWKGPAVRRADGASGTLQVTPEGISFGGMLRRDKTPLELLAGAKADGETLTLRFRGLATPVEYDVEETELAVHLKSGERIAHLTAEDLAQRLEAVVAAQLGVPSP